MGWTTADIPDQSGRVAVVTGANGGLGLEVAMALAARAPRS
jgi:protochlorophyllide reductase